MLWLHENDRTEKKLQIEGKIKFLKAFTKIALNLYSLFLCERLLERIFPLAAVSIRNVHQLSSIMDDIHGRHDVLFFRRLKNLPMSLNRGVKDQHNINVLRFYYLVKLKENV